MALVVLQVLIVFDISSFEFHQAELLWLHIVHNKDELTLVHPTSFHWNVWGYCWSLITSCIRRQIQCRV